MFLKEIQKEFLKKFLEDLSRKFLPDFVADIPRNLTIILANIPLGNINTSRNFCRNLNENFSKFLKLFPGTFSIFEKKSSGIPS